MKRTNPNDTIVAISTPVGEGGIGIVRLSGRDVFGIADKIFLPKDGLKPSQFKTYTTHYGHIMDSATQKIIDEVILTVMRSPKSYTKEDIVEINCHGGIVPLKKILELVVGMGARVAEPGEFTKRAFLNGRIDLLQAEAVLDVIRSKTEAGLEAALSQLRGGLSDTINEVKNDIMNSYVHIEASIDFPDEDINVQDSRKLSEQMTAVIDKMQNLLKTSEKGKILRQGLSAVICGKPNVGKSTLMNLLLKENRVIVTPIPGTTRDIVEETINIDGIPLKIADTAGIAESLDAVEKEGVRRSHEYIKGADIVLFLMDNSRKLTAEDKAIIDMIKDKKAVVIINKIDLPKKLKLDEIIDDLRNKKRVEVSATKGTHLDLLEKAISNMVWSGEVIQHNQPFITNVRHSDALKKAYKYIKQAKGSLEKKLSPEFVALDVKEALDALGEIVGESIGKDLLNRIFGEFCIGK